MGESLLIDSKLGIGSRMTFDDTFDPALEPAEGWAFLHKYGTKRTFPPLTPEDFKMELEKRRKRVNAKDLKLFVEDRDLELVPEMYAHSFVHFEEANVLTYP